MASLLRSVLLAVLLCVLVRSADPAVGQSAPPKVVTVKVQRDGKTFYGKPLATDGTQLAIVRWDGRLTVFPFNDPGVKVTNYRNGFEPYSPDELQERLGKYFGNRYEISKTEHFVVIHPKGGTAFWAEPFQKHYEQLKDYFTTNGFKMTEPEFPMVAIVLRSRKEFDLQLKKEDTFDKSILGYYSKKSNRITTYAPSGLRLTPTGAQQTKGWLESSPTVVHEVAHQIAFNGGLHNRFSSVPKWISEGLATLCETRGVYNFRSAPSIESRVNKTRLKSFRKFRDQGKTSGKLLELIQDDRLFSTDPELAYAVAWAISFYLNENRQAKYFDFLRKDALRGEFQVHDKLDRVGFFIRHFGNNINALEKRMNLFVDALQ